MRLLIWPAGLLSLSAAGLTDLGLVVVPSVGPSPPVEVSKADGGASDIGGVSASNGGYSSGG